MILRSAGDPWGTIFVSIHDKEPPTALSSETAYVSLYQPPPQIGLDKVHYGRVATLTGIGTKSIAVPRLSSVSHASVAFQSNQPCSHWESFEDLSEARLRLLLKEKNKEEKRQCSRESIDAFTK